MAITNANFNNADFVKASGKRIITCTSDKIGTTGVFNYRFLLELTINGTVYSYTFRPNNEGYGFINITKILQSHIKDIGDVQQTLTVPSRATSSDTPQFKQNIHAMPYKASATTQALTSVNNNTFSILARLHDFYGDTATAVPTKRTTGIQQSNIYVICGYDKETDLINVDYEKYYLSSNVSEFLNNNFNFERNALGGSNYTIYCSYYDWGTLSMFRPTFFNPQIADYIIVRYFNDSGSLLGTLSMGGINTTSAVTTGLITTIGVYPQNLNKLSSGNLPSSYTSNLAYYEVYASNTYAGVGSVLSQHYRFVLTERFKQNNAFQQGIEFCRKYNRQRFAYINNFGVWEYITFTELRRDNITSSPTNIKGSVYNYDGNFEDITSLNKYYREIGYIPDVAHRGEKTVATNFNETFTVNTGFLSDGDIQKVKEMFLSNKISYINDDGSARAVILENSTINAVNSIVKATPETTPPRLFDSSKQYEQVSYQLTFRYSVPTNNNIVF